MQEFAFLTKKTERGELFTDEDFAQLSLTPLMASCQMLDVTALNEEAEKIVQFFFDIPESGNLPAYFFLVS